MKDRILQLLTAFVDGELSRRERKAALKLLNRSSAARDFVRQLQVNAHAIKQLSQRRLPRDFATTVLRAIRAKETTPLLEKTPAAHAPRLPSSRRGWQVGAAAAVAFVAVSAWVYYFATQDPSGPIAPVVQAPDLKDVGPLTLADLRDESNQQLLTRELRREPSPHLDLNVKSSAQMVAKIKDVFQEGGIRVLVDPAAQASLTRETPTDYLVYVENVSPDETTSLLSRLTGDDKATLLVHAMSAADRKILAGFLEPSQSRPRDKEDKVPLDIFISSKEKEPAPPPRTLERCAMVLPLSKDTPRDSAELKTFLSRRQQAHPGTIRLMLIVHQV